ncbi:G protein-coupled receptor kinase 5-like [Dysidea avara]|uniref:G protein-coupled receptor kinase 5-like n=1 Tax=Dysidea avara TaxID=196820 RepID=UPI00331F1B14
MLELESIAADRSLVKARLHGEGSKAKGRSRKWKEMLKFPGVAQAMSLDREINKDFTYIVDSQPIGENLFKLYCQKTIELMFCMEFLQALNNFRMMVADKHNETAKKIYAEFIKSDGPKSLGLFDDDVSSDIAMMLDNDTGSLSKDIYEECRRLVKQHLMGEAYKAFLASPYYWRYLQWKYIERAPITKEHFRQYRVLGKGGFGLVFACQSKTTGRMYALKKLEKKRVKKRRGEKLALNEKTILERVNSRFVVNLAYTYQTKDSLCLVLTLLNGGDLRFHIHNLGDPGLDEERAVFYAAEIALGLQHLHAVRIIYRDMKPENILLDDNGHIRISDLGLAIELPEGQKAKGRVGTVGYMAPEVINHDRYGFTVDWWGLGCIVYEMIQGESPFRRRKEKVTRDEVERRVKEDGEVYTSKFSEEARSLCTMLLQKQHTHRLGCGQRGALDLRPHPFFRHIQWSQLEAGHIPAPYVPNPNAVYCKDMLEIEQFSSVKGVDIDGTDMQFHARFSSGSNSVPWQKEMIESKAFEEMNSTYPIEPDAEPYSPSLHPPGAAASASAGSGGFLQKLKGKFKRQASSSL